MNICIKNIEFKKEEIATFKRYIEENNVYNENSFEFFERNMDYFSSRHTRDNFVCISELFHANSDYWNTAEINENIELYKKFVLWRNKTVHPEDSEYVLKEEKYIYINSFPKKIRDIFEKFNKESIELFSCIDLIFYINGSFYQYLPQKKFAFTWKKNGEKLINQVSSVISKKLKDCVVVFPIFIPIRKIIFLGEYGYREAVIDYGVLLSKIRDTITDSKIIRRFETRVINNYFHLDSIEKSILSLIYFKNKED